MVPTEHLVSINEVANFLHLHKFAETDSWNERIVKNTCIVEIKGNSNYIQLKMSLKLTKKKRVVITDSIKKLS